MPVSSTKGVERIAPLLLIAAVTLFFLFTIRAGHEWGGDFSQYIHHAKNIAEGQSYSDIGYIYNPERPNLGPRAYPPVYPLLLAPVYKFFGLSLKAMKVETVFIFAIFLLVVLKSFKRDLPPAYLAIFIAALGFNHHFWGLKEHIISEIPFILFSYSALLMINRAGSTDGEERESPATLHPALLAIFTGVLIYLAYGTRGIAVVLLPAMIFSDLIRRRRISSSSIIAAVVFVVLAIGQDRLVGSGGSYIELFVLGLNGEIFIKNLGKYAAILPSLWDNGYNSHLTAFLFWLMSALSVAGLIQRLRHGISVYELFVFFYLSLALLWPTYIGYRLFMPVVPLYIFYIFIALKWISDARVARSGLGGRALLVVSFLIAVSYVAVYSTKDYGPFKTGVEIKESKELFEVIESRSEESDVFVFRKPRVLALYTGRSASVYHGPGEPQRLWEYFSKIGADYFVAGTFDDEYMKPFAERYREMLEPVYVNSYFVIYRIRKHEA